MMDKGQSLVIGIIMMAIAGGVLATQNAQTLGGALNYLIAGFAPLGLGVKLLVDAFK